MDLNNLIKAQWDRTAAIVSTVLGAIFLIVGYIGVSGDALLAKQTPYIISGGIGGIFFLGLGATLWISADLRDEWRKLDRIEEALRDGSLRWTDDDGLEDHFLQNADYGQAEAPELTARLGATTPAGAPRSPAKATRRASTTSTRAKR